MRYLLRRTVWITLLPIAMGATAQDIELPLQQSRLAGYRYHGAPAVRGELVPGEILELVREPGNTHDANAIRIEWRGIMLGYVPRTQNAALAWHMDRGITPRARITPRANKRARRLEFEIFLR